ncbi:MAG: hypothetical protein K4571_01595 [Deltaproteobacteria bacterium]
MIDRVKYYEFGFFAPESSVEATTDIMVKLLGQFKDKGLLPTELVWQNRTVT